MEIDPETLWVSRQVDAANQFSSSCRRLAEENPSGHPRPLSHMVNSLMTELWDHGFSQEEIRVAFLDAVADLPRYAGGQERR